MYLRTPQFLLLAINFVLRDDKLPAGKRNDVFFLSDSFVWSTNNFQPSRLLFDSQISCKYPEEGKNAHIGIIY